MEQQIIKGEVWTRTQVKNNIMKVWNATNDNDRFDWYQAAYQFAVSLTDLDPDRCSPHIGSLGRACGVIAALSPMVHWNHNKKLAIQLYNRPGDRLGCLQTNARKAYQILHCDGKDDTILGILKGKKTSAFFLNIRYPDKAISMTMDRHAISIALGRKITKDESKFFQLTAGQYKFLVECYRWTAAKLEINPLTLQSATWVLWRREGRNTELPYYLDF